ncbi:MAG: shikimate kinase [Desulfovibrionaceae bacterium]|nr:shikimate kinase [Desulfovibrionaceae bacterium]
MPGAGKSTIGAALARDLGWPYLDSDHLIEATYAHRLQDVVDLTDKATFLDIEASVIKLIRANRLVIGTGGSVVYREAAMEHLQKLGFIVHLDVPLDVLKERIASNPERGIAIAPGQTIEDIFNERKPLYRKWSNLSCNNYAMTVQECVALIKSSLPATFLEEKC